MLWRIMSRDVSGVQVEMTVVPFSDVFTLSTVYRCIPARSVGKSGGECLVSCTWSILGCCTRFSPWSGIRGLLGQQLSIYCQQSHLYWMYSQWEETATGYTAIPCHCCTQPQPGIVYPVQPELNYICLRSKISAKMAGNLAEKVFAVGNFFAKIHDHHYTTTENLCGFTFCYCEHLYKFSR